MRDGFLRVRVDGAVREIEPGMQVDRYKVHSIEIVVDRIVVRGESRTRVADSVEVALRFGNGTIIANVLGGATDTGNGQGKARRTPKAGPAPKKSAKAEEDVLFSRHLSCAFCNISYEEPAPNSFSFNSPFGACPTCNGLGEVKELDTRLMIPDPSLSINQEGLAPLGKPRQTWVFSQIRAVGKTYGFDFDTPIKKMSKRAQEILLNGGGEEKFEIEYRYASGRTA